MYLASSIVKSLRNARGLSITGLDLVICPVDSCITAPETCGKGHSQACGKRIDILYEHDGHNKLAVLVFRYRLRGSGREGFIRKEDAALKILLNRGIISKDTLTAA